MNTKLLNVIKEIVAKNGEPVLSEPKRVSALLSDLAREEPEPRKNAIVKSLEQGFAQILKNVSPSELNNCKKNLAQRLRDKEGYDLGLCEDTVALLAAATLETAATGNAVCPSCGKSVPPGKFCLECGANMQSACAHCNAQLPAGAKFCLECGKPVVAATSANVKTSSSTEVEYLCRRGEEFLNMKQFDKAIKDFNKAIKLDQQYARAYVGRGEAFVNKFYPEGGSYDEAAIKVHNDLCDKAFDDFTTAIALDPSYAPAYVDRGDIFSDELYDGFDNDKAFYDYTKAIELDPKNADTYYRRGCVFSNDLGSMFDHDKAIDDFTKAINLDPNIAYYYESRGDAFLEEECEKAINDYTKAIELDPKNAFTYASRGKAFRDNKQFDKSINDYTKAIELDHDHYYGWENDIKKAQEALKKK